MKHLLPIVLIGMTVCACSSKPPVKGYMEDEILSTSNNKSQPDWADETKPFYIENGKVHSVGLTTLLGSERPEAGMRISENNARANIAKIIQNRMEFIFQNSEENAAFDSTQSKYIGSEVSSLTSSSIMVKGHWYKRYATSEEDGSRRIYYKIYSLVTMPEEELKRAIDRAINHRVDERKLSPTFQEQVDRQWDKFTEVKSDQLVPDAGVSDSMKGKSSVQVEKTEVKEKVDILLESGTKEAKPAASVEKPSIAPIIKAEVPNVPTSTGELVKAVINTAEQAQ